YFRPDYDENGFLEFVPTAELRQLQIGQALMSGLTVHGNKDDGPWFSGFMRGPAKGVSEKAGFSVPRTPEEAIAWYEVFGTTSPFQLLTDVRRVGGLEG